MLGFSSLLLILSRTPAAPPAPSPPFDPSASRLVRGPPPTCLPYRRPPRCLALFPQTLLNRLAMMFFQQAARNLVSSQGVDLLICCFMLCTKVFIYVHDARFTYVVHIITHKMGLPSGNLFELNVMDRSDDLPWHRRAAVRMSS